MAIAAGHELGTGLWWERAVFISSALSKVSWHSHLFKSRSCQCQYLLSRAGFWAGGGLHRYGPSKANLMGQGGLWAQWPPEDP